MNQPIICGHCSRQFADWAFLEEHIKKCRQEAQEKLDRDYLERNMPNPYPPLPHKKS